MKKIIISFVVLIFPFAHIVFAQNNQTIIVRPETSREKEERKMNDVVETFKLLGELGRIEKQARENTLNNAKKSRYSVYVEEKLTKWKKKGEFEKTADWQKRLQDSTAIKKADIQESYVDRYAFELGVIQGYSFYQSSSYRLEEYFYDSEGKYDAEKEVLIINSFWGPIPIPIPIEKAKDMQNDFKYIRVLDASFFIQNDRLALLSVEYNGYTYITEEEKRKQNLNLQRELLVQADDFNKNYQFERALEVYQKALQTSPENMDVIRNRIEFVEHKIQQHNSLIKQASNFERSKNYAQAKDAWQKAYNLKPQKETQDKINENNRMLLFLKERETTTYDYKSRFPSDYKRIDKINNSVLTDIVLKTPNISETKIKIISQSDTVGYTTNFLETTISDAALSRQLTNMSNNIKLDAQINGFSVAAEAFFDYNISSEEAVIKIKKRYNKFTSKNDKLKDYYSGAYNVLLDASYGNFTIQFNKAVINDTSHVKSKLLEYKDTGGPSNALLSLLVPGLGDYRVTYGKKSGVGTALWTYGLIGAGVGLKFYSNSEYDKYHAATSQEAMDDHYIKANYSNQAFYACVGTGALIWIYDIIWVWKTGAENVKKQKAYKRSHLGAYYDPNMQATGLSYTINF